MTTVSGFAAVFDGLKDGDEISFQDFSFVAKSGGVNIVRHNGAAHYVGLPYSRESNMPVAQAKAIAKTVSDMLALTSFRLEFEGAYDMFGRKVELMTRVQGAWDSGERVEQDWTSEQWELALERTNELRYTARLLERMEPFRAMSVTPNG